MHYMIKKAKVHSPPNRFSWQICTGVILALQVILFDYVTIWFSTGVYKNGGLFLGRSKIISGKENGSLPVYAQKTASPLTGVLGVLSYTYTTGRHSPYGELTRWRIDQKMLRISECSKTYGLRCEMACLASSPMKLDLRQITNGAGVVLTSWYSLFGHWRFLPRFLPNRCHITELW